MTEEEKDLLRETKIHCREKLTVIKSTLDKLTKQKDKCWEEYLFWKDRYERADVKLALETKLTIVKRGRKSETADSLEIILQDKEKVKKLVELLGKEKKADTMTPNVPFTMT